MEISVAASFDFDFSLSFGDFCIESNLYIFSFLRVAVEGADRDTSEAPNGQSNGKINLQKAVWKETKASWF